jgi:hypothetical protein
LATRANLSIRTLRRLHLYIDCRLASDGRCLKANAMASHLWLHLGGDATTFHQPVIGENLVIVHQAYIFARAVAQERPDFHGLAHHGLHGVEK